jgi:hypothetical protein
MKLYEKLHAIQCAVMGLKKDTKGNNYQYVSGAKVLEHIKPLMNQHKLILKQEVLSIENTRQDYQTRNGSKSEINSKVMMRFTWVDCETGDKDENLFGANGQNDWDKGVGSALTYGERYFLLKYFHIDTDEDDIDNPNRNTTEPISPSTPPVKPIEKKVLEQDSIEWHTVTKALTDKKVTLEYVKSKFILSAEIEGALKLIDNDRY